MYHSSLWMGGVRIMNVRDGLRQDEDESNLKQNLFNLGLIS